MRTAAVCLLASLALGSPAFAAERAAKHASPVQCKTSVDDFLHIMAGAAKSLSYSAALTPKQYSFAAAAVKEHSKDHQTAPGDGALIIDTDGDFALVFTKGSEGVNKVCAVMAVPADAVASILGIEMPSAAPETKDNPDRPWL